MTDARFSGITAAFAAALAFTGQGLASPLPETLGNIAYFGIYEGPVELVDGAYEGEPFVPNGAARPRVELLTDLYLTGDIDGDGKDDAWVLLNENSGGTGQILYLAAVADIAGEPRNLDTVVIGDRVDVMGLAAADGNARLDYVAPGPGEPACCPTRMITAVYGMRNGELTELSREDRGTLSVAQLAGPGWQLARFDWNETLAEGISITATFEGERISGFGGCNRYFATIEAPTPYELKIGPVGATRKACPPPQMEAEDRYLKALEAATQFSFVLGKLAITYELGGALGTLVFERAGSD